MLKLVSEEGTRWSYLDGYNVFGNVVWLLDENDVLKYSLLDKDGNKLKVNNRDYLVNDEY